MRTPVTLEVELGRYLVRIHTQYIQRLSSTSSDFCCCCCVRFTSRGAAFMSVLLHNHRWPTAAFSLRACTAPRPQAATDSCWSTRVLGLVRPAFYGAYHHISAVSAATRLPYPADSPQAPTVVAARCVNRGVFTQTEEVIDPRPCPPPFSRGPAGAAYRWRVRRHDVE